VKKSFDAIRHAGGSVLAITPSKPEVVAMHAARREWPFPVVGDPERKAYRAFGLDRMPLLRFFHPRVLFAYLWRMLKGWLPRPPKAGEDVMQLGGDFILDRTLTVRFAHPSTDPADRPSMQALLAAVEKTRAGGH
jgi:peroxiredoxin